MSSFLELLESYSERQRSAREWLVMPRQWYGHGWPYAPSQFIDVELALRDPNAHDGAWRDVVTLEHEVVEHDGLEVPAFEGDVERREWEARRLRSRR